MYGRVSQKGKLVSKATIAVACDINTELENLEKKMKKILESILSQQNRKAGMIW